MLDGFGFAEFGNSPFGGVSTDSDSVAVLAGESGWSANAVVRVFTAVSLSGEASCSVDQYGISIRVGRGRRKRTPARPDKRKVPPPRLPGNYRIGKKRHT